MSLISISQSPVQNAMLALQSSTNGMFDSIVSQSTQIFNFIWYNPDPTLTPDVLIAALGTNAGALINANQGLQTLFNTLKPGSFVLTRPAGWSVVVNDDGSATASYTAP